jgi:hypothetical protein
VTRTLAVVGVHPTLRPRLDRIGREHDFRVLPLLPYRKVVHAASYDIDELLRDARADLRDVDVEGITTYWDFPSSCLAAILAEEQGLPTPGLRAVTSFEHKHWSRSLQREVAPDETPAFAAVDVGSEGHLDDPPLPYPFWLKPIKAYSSHLGFRIDGPHDLHRALAVLRRRIGRLGTPFQQVLERVSDLPDEVAEVPGTWAIAEGLIDGHQCTVEGHVHAGDVSVHGVFDIEREENRSTFTDYVYPSRLPDHVRARLRDIAAHLMDAAGFDDGSFNIEFFWDEDADRTWILEVNPRISREHTDLMLWVDGATNLQVMAQTALGERPELQRRAGPHTVARKHFHRRAEDGIVERVPTGDEIAAIEARHAPCVIELTVPEGARLSEVEDQEPYSYELVDLYLAGGSEEAVEHERRAVLAELDLRIADVETAAPGRQES